MPAPKPALCRPYTCCTKTGFVPTLNLPHQNRLCIGTKPAVAFWINISTVSKVRCDCQGLGLEARIEVSILVFDTIQVLYWPVLGQIQFCSFDRTCKTCLDTKPVLYQGRFCSLTVDVQKTALLHAIFWQSNAKTPLMTELTEEYIYHHASVSVLYDDVIKSSQLLRYWPYVRDIHRAPVNSSHRGQWRGDLMFSFIYASINAGINNREAGDLRHHRAHWVFIGITEVSHMASGSPFIDRNWPWLPGTWWRKDLLPAYVILLAMWGELSYKYIVSLTHHV